MKNIKYVVWGVAVVIVVIIAVSYFRPSENNSVVRIGFSSALTGPVQMPGNWALKGAQLAVKELNEKGVNVELIVEDDMCNPVEATKTFNKFINVDKVNNIFIFCSAALPSTVTMTKDKALVLYSSIKVTDQDNYHTLYPDVNLEMNKLTDYIINDQQIKHIAQIYQKDAAGEAIKQAFVSSFESNGGKVAFSEGVSNFDGSDTRTLLLKLKSQNVQGIMLTGAVGNFIKTVKQMNELGINIPVFSNSLGAENPTVIKELGDLSEGIVFSAPYRDNINPDFENNYFKEYNEKPGVWSALAYDSILVFADMNKKCGSDIACNKKEITKTNFSGATGEFVFNDDLSVNREIFLKKIVGGKFQVIE